MPGILRKIIIAFLILFVGSVSTSFAQGNYDFLFEDGKNYNPNRFGLSLGSPMLFDPWVVGTVYSNTGSTYYPLMVNFNVFEGKWEARGNGKIITLDPEYFWCIMVFKKDNLFADKNIADTMVYIRGLLPKNENEYAQILYNGQNFKLIKQFKVSKSKQTGNNENQFALARYAHRAIYYLVFESKHQRVGLNKKDMIKAFKKDKKAIKKYLDQEELDPKAEYEWIEVLNKIEKEFYPTY